MLLLAYWQRNDGGHTIPCQLAIITIIIIIMGATQTRARHHYSQYCRLAFLHTAAGAPFSHQIYTYLHVRGIAYTCTGSWHGRASALCTHCTCRCSVRTRTLWFTYTKQCINEIIFRIGICLLVVGFVVFPPPPFFIHWWLCSILRFYVVWITISIWPTIKRQCVSYDAFVECVCIICSLNLYECVVCCRVLCRE